LEFAGGGYIHYCGRNDHLMKRSLELDLNHGINLGNTDKHDMDAVLKQTAQAGKIYYGYLHRPDGEDHAAFFRRVRNAATAGGKCRLLLTYYADAKTKDEIRCAWDGIAQDNEG